MKVTTIDAPVAQIFQKTCIFEYPLEKIWNPDGISLSKRLKQDPGLEKRLKKILDSKNLEQYIVPVDSSAPTRCIDGRPICNWDELPDAKKKFLGPKVPGGTPHAALTQRIVDATHLNRELHFEDDILAVVKLYKKTGIGFGGHVDTHHNGWNTGCGAVDKINLILHKLQRPEPQEQIRMLAREMMGKAYEGNHMVNEVIGSMLLLDAVKPSYMPKEGGKAEKEFLYKKTVVKLLREEVSGKDNVPALEGEHAEVALVLNWVKGTTFDNDRFAIDNNGEIQVFGWDIWEVYEEAGRLYPYSMYDSPLVQQEAVTKRLNHITTRILLGISTTMVLTDGSLRLVTVK
jgi:hypothetical protein